MKHQSTPTEPSTSIMMANLTGPHENVELIICNDDKVVTGNSNREYYNNNSNNSKHKRVGLGADMSDMSLDLADLAEFAAADDVDNDKNNNNIKNDNNNNHPNNRLSTHTYDDTTNNRDTYDDDDSTSTEDENQGKKGIQIINNKQNRNIRIIRWTCIVVFLFLSINICCFVYFVLHRMEYNHFANTFSKEAKELKTSLEINMSNKLHIISSLNMAVVSSQSQSQQQPMSWPYVTVPDLSLLLQHASDVTEAAAVAASSHQCDEHQQQQNNADTNINTKTKNKDATFFVPIVTETNRNKWEKFSRGQIYSKNNTATTINADDDPYYFPIWQQSPKKGKLNNFNLLSNTDYFRDGILAMMESRKIVFGGTTKMVSSSLPKEESNYDDDLISEYYHYDNEDDIIYEYYKELRNNNNISSNNIDNQRINWLKSSTSSLNKTTTAGGGLGTRLIDPLSHIFYPIFDSSFRSSSSSRATSDNKPLVGMFAVTIFWNDFLQQSIPSTTSSGITVVVKNECKNDHQSFTFTTTTTNDEDDYVVTLNEVDPLDDTFIVKDIEIVYHIQRGSSNSNIQRQDLDNRNNYSKSNNIRHSSSSSSFDSTTTTLVNNDNDNCEICSYSIRIYPSRQYYQNNSSTLWPILSTLFCVILLCIMLALGLLYDHIILSTMLQVEAAAQKTDAIVSSFFPANVRYRLFRGEENSLSSARSSKIMMKKHASIIEQQKGLVDRKFNSSMNSSGSVSSKNLHHHNGSSSFIEYTRKSFKFLRGIMRRNEKHAATTTLAAYNPLGQKVSKIKNCSGDKYDNGNKFEGGAKERKLDEVDEAIHWKPIADLYPYCTVFFADISGFTAWSSSREPAQVFTLLQVIFRAFDKAAKKYGIFKVETIGDCYLCITGIPDYQPDHAVRMVKFARRCMYKTNELVEKMERVLGPDTGALRIRIGLHSGPVTAGVLRGEKARFQLFGDTVNTASRMESNGERNRIQISSTTAVLIIEAGKEHWIKQRHDLVKVKGKGEMQTWWVIMRTMENTSENEENGDDEEKKDLSKTPSAMRTATTINTNNDHDSTTSIEEDNFISTSKPLLSRSKKNKRLVQWISDLLIPRLKQIKAQREATAAACGNNTNMTNISQEDLRSVNFEGGSPIDEVVESFTPSEDQIIMDSPIDISDVELSDSVIEQLHEFVKRIANMYRDNPFHNFEHACHVTMSVEKLLHRIETTTPTASDTIEKLRESSANFSIVTNSSTQQHNYTYGITSNALAQFAIIFSALIHDVDHSGISNDELVKEDPVLGEKYKNSSVAEQNSIDIAWGYLMDPNMKDLRQCIFSNMHQLTRFRQLVVNSVMATDIFDKTGKAFREKRWDKAFTQNSCHVHDANCWHIMEKNKIEELKATIVLEHIIQASDISHTMQHWNIYMQWNEQLFRETYLAFDSGRSNNDPSIDWYINELSFFDNYVIPLAKKLDHCRVFGVTSDECLLTAVENRREFALKGKSIVNDMIDRYHKRKSMEIGGLTDEEISAFTPQDLEYIIKKLVKKGQSNSTNKVSAKGQNDATQAWLDGLEIWERAPAGIEVSDRSIIFPVISGTLVWLKAGKIRQDKDSYFEQNLSNIFVRESFLHGDPVHYTRALSMKCDVMGRLGKYNIAFETFKTLQDVYDPKKHSNAVAKVYAADRSAHAFSQCALWHMQCGNTKAAIEACEYVINYLFAFMDQSNTLGNFELLWPVIRTLKPLGQEKRMRDVLNEKIVQNFYKHHGPNGKTPVKSIFKPLLMLLDICCSPKARPEETNPNFAEEVEWLIQEDNGTFPDFVDSIFMQQCWSISGMTAELCLRFANKLILFCDNDDAVNVFRIKKLIRKGLKLAMKLDKKLRGGPNNTVHLPIPYEIHRPVLTGLMKLATDFVIIDDIEDVKYTPLPCIDVKLPPSYLKPNNE